MESLRFGTFSNRLKLGSSQRITEFRVAVVGPRRCGKSALINQFVHKSAHGPLFPLAAANGDDSARSSGGNVPMKKKVAFCDRVFLLDIREIPASLLFASDSVWDPDAIASGNACSELSSCQGFVFVHSSADPDSQREIIRAATFVKRLVVVAAGTELPMVLVDNTAGGGSGDKSSALSAEVRTMFDDSPTFQVDVESGSGVRDAFQAALMEMVRLSQAQDASSSAVVAAAAANSSVTRRKRAVTVNDAFEVKYVDGPEGKPNQISAATVDKLVERLTDPDLLDMDFFSSFLLTYRAFFPSAVLFDKLCERFAGAADEEGSRIRLRIVNVFKVWFDTSIYDFLEDQALLTRVTRFISEDMARESAQSATMLERILKKKAANEHMLKETVFAHSEKAPAPVVSKVVASGRFSFLDLDPLEVARQLTLLEWNLYSSIRPKECLNLAWTDAEADKTAPNVAELVRRFGLVSQWVASEVVMEKRAKQRVVVLKTFIKIAGHLRSLNNLHGVMEIVTGLELCSVHRLSKTWKGLSSRKQALFRSLKELMSPADNYRAFRSNLHSLNPPCIPYIGVFLSDLSAIEAAHPSWVDGGLINFEKCQMLAKTLREIQLYQQEAYSFQTVPMIYNYLVNLSPIPESTLYQHSLVLESQDSIAGKSGLSFLRKGPVTFEASEATIVPTVNGTAPATALAADPNSPDLVAVATRVFAQSNGADMSTLVDQAARFGSGANATAVGAGPSDAASGTTPAKDAMSKLESGISNARGMSLISLLKEWKHMLANTDAVYALDTPPGTPKRPLLLTFREVLIRSRAIEVLVTGILKTPQPLDAENDAVEAIFSACLIGTPTFHRNLLSGLRTLARFSVPSQLLPVVIAGIGAFKLAPLHAHVQRRWAKIDGRKNELEAELEEIDTREGAHSVSSMAHAVATSANVVKLASFRLQLVANYAILPSLDRSSLAADLLPIQSLSEYLQTSPSVRFDFALSPSAAVPWKPRRLSESQGGSWIGGGDNEFGDEDEDDVDEVCQLGEGAEPGALGLGLGNTLDSNADDDADSADEGDFDVFISDCSERITVVFRDFLRVFRDYILVKQKEDLASAEKFATDVRTNYLDTFRRHEERVADLLVLLKTRFADTVSLQTTTTARAQSDADRNRVLHQSIDVSLGQDLACFRDVCVHLDEVEAFVRSDNATASCAPIDVDRLFHGIVSLRRSQREIEDMLNIITGPPPYPPPPPAGGI